MRSRLFGAARATANTLPYPNRTSDGIGVITRASGRINAIFVFSTNYINIHIVMRRVALCKPCCLQICCATLITIATTIYAEHAGAAISFADATAGSGINHSGPSFGASWGDFDGDGLPDIWVGNHYTPPSLYLNNGNGTFNDIASLVSSGFGAADTHGAAWADFDNDGDQDLIEVAGGGAPNSLFVNENGVFMDQAQTLGVALAGGRYRTPLWLDWDRDGRLDLVLTQLLGIGQFPFVLRNNGAGFEDATATVGIRSAHSTFAQLADLNEDGQLDLVTQFLTFPGRLFHITNIPFQNISSSLVFPAQSGASVDHVIADFTGDLRDDIFIPRQGANYELVVRSDQRIDFKLTAVRNEKAVTFQAGGPINISIGPYSGAIPQALVRIGPLMQSPSSFAFTLDPNDPAVWGIPTHVAGVEEGVFIGFDTATQRWSIAYSTPSSSYINFVVETTSSITNIKTIGFDASPPAAWPSYFVRNDAGFEERRSENGLGFGMPCNSVVGGDFDNDMDMDLYLACARPVANAPNMLFENLGDGTFAEVPNGGGAAGSNEGRSDTVVTADYDEDGFLDLFVTNGHERDPFNQGPNQLFRNLGNTNHWIEIDLVGLFSNPDGIGATITVATAGRTQKRASDGGMHRYAQNYKRLHFGLGTHTIVDQIQVQWPSGIVQTLTNIPSDQILPIVETGVPVPVNQAPIADPNGPYTGMVGDMITFDGTGSTDDGIIMQYDWDFGDGTVVNNAGPTPTHMYATVASTFTVSLTVTDDGSPPRVNTATTTAIISPLATGDADSDGVPDEQDNCINAVNGTAIPDAGGNSQLDTDGDGFGNICDGDFNSNSIIDPADISLLKSTIGSPTAPDQDLNGNGIVDTTDFSILKSFLGKPPGPSCCAP